MDCSPPGSSVLGIPQARILEWVAIAFSRGSSNPGMKLPLLRLLHRQAGSLPLHHLGRPLSATTSVFISIKVLLCFSEPLVSVRTCPSVILSSPSPFPYPPDAPGVGVGGSPVVNIWESTGFPGGTSGKEPACQRRRYERCRFHPWVGKIPWRRAWQPTPVFLPGESHGRRSLVGYSP